MSNINFDYKNLSPFKWFVLENFPFIEADFDALTEWQLFCKIGKEINKIIDSQNIVGEQAETLTNAFNNLKNYVDNYFNNLDVQDEINNKLNEMALDGTFTNLIGNYVNAYITPTINNLQSQINGLANGSPLVASSIGEMKDTSRVYVNTTNGHWYWYNGATWVDGGIYQSTGIADHSITIPKLENQIINDLYIKSPNEYDKNNISINKALITWDKTKNINNCTFQKDGWFVSNIINVKPNTTLKIYRKNENDNKLRTSIYNSIIFFDKNGNIISYGPTNSDTVNVPLNSKYAIFDSNDLDIRNRLFVCESDYDITNGYFDYGYTSNIVQKQEVKQELEDYIKKENKTYIMFSFDAFKTNEDDPRFVIMRKNKFPCVIAVSQTTLKYSISQEEYYRLIRDNVELSVYAGVGERPSSYYDASQEEEWDNWITNLVNGLKESSGIFEPIMYSCQNATTGPNQEKAIKNNGFLLSRANKIYNSDGTYYTPGTPDEFLIDGLKSSILPSHDIRKSTKVSEITSLIDYAIAQHKSLMFLAHYVLPENEAGEYDAIDTTFTAIVNYVKKKQDEGLLEVVSPSQFYNIYKPGEKADYKEKKRIQLRTNFDFNNL